MIGEEPLVSVLMITYGHEKYIERAITSVLMQECDFTVELIVANDCSPDDTDYIVKGIINNHPKSDWIKYTNHFYNKGMQPNFVWACEQAKGTYIALCEGDDYWTDPLKLQKQVNFMMFHDDYAMCSHNVFIVDGFEEKVSPGLNTCDLSSIDVLTKECFNFIPTCSIVFKNIFKNNNFPYWYNKMPFGDWPLITILSTHGKIRFFEDIMGVYNKHSGGATSISNLKMSILLRDFYFIMYGIFPQYQSQIVSRIDELNNRVFTLLAKLESKEVSAKTLANSIPLFRLIKAVIYKAYLSLRANFKRT